jgi:nucleoside-diphosphate-sugar epimerase
MRIAPHLRLRGTLIEVVRAAARTRDTYLAAQYQRVVRARRGANRASLAVAQWLPVRTRRGDVRHSQADISAAERELGFRPQVSVEEGLRLTLDWFGRSLDWFGR